MRVNVESSALAETRFYKLTEHYFEGSRAEAIGSLVLFWFDSQEREFVSGAKAEVVSFMPFSDEENERFFESLLKYGYIKETGLDIYEISGNDKHVEKRKALSQVRRQSAVKANQVRWGNRKTSQTYPKPIAKDPVNSVQCSAVQYNSIHKEKSIKSEFDFEAIYNLYPKKEGKTKGIEFCQKNIKTKEDYDLLLKAVTRYSKNCRTERTEKKFIKLFSSFMSVWKDYAYDDPVPIKYTPVVSVMPQPEEPHPGGKPLSDELKRLKDIALRRIPAKPHDEPPGAA